MPFRLSESDLVGMAGVFGAILFFAGIVVAAVINIAFATGVYARAQVQDRKRALLFVSPFLRALATLLGGVFVAAAFWIMHMPALSSASGRVAQDSP